ncbi:HNH endonuclease [Listeria ilorinensis]|uniref:HNH endonuclease n=1 Tax=Listeria ilorinensis TaxID=2867439 RepID=UPI001EF56A5C|nr:HNH endonuclease [Listeria ilorinensis]
MLSKEKRLRFYKSGPWKRVRQDVLERDNYECQECKRSGRVTTKVTTELVKLDVDHIKDLEHYPELALDLDNLETLCQVCHNRKHHRFAKKVNRWAHDEKW